MIIRWYHFHESSILTYQVSQKYFKIVCKNAEQSSCFHFSLNIYISNIIYTCKDQISEVQTMNMHCIYTNWCIKGTSSCFSLFILTQSCIQLQIDDDDEHCTKKFQSNMIFVGDLHNRSNILYLGWKICLNHEWGAQLKYLIWLWFSCNEISEARSLSPL